MSSSAAIVLRRALRFEKKRHQALTTPGGRRRDDAASSEMRPFGREDVSHVTRALVKSTLMPAAEAVFTLVYFEKSRTRNVNFRVVSSDAADVLHADGSLRRHGREELVDMLFSRVVQIARDVGVDVADTERGAVDGLLLFGSAYLMGVSPPYPPTGGGAPPGPLQGSVTGAWRDVMFEWKI